MKLKGAVRASDLPDIFQMLSTSGRHGVLVVTRDGDERKVYFGPKGVTPVYDLRRSESELGQFLLGCGVINETCLENALERHRASGDPISDILCRLGAARPEQVENALSYKLREELFDILTWNQGRFEFLEGAAAPSLPVYNHVRTPLFNADAILMEAARRVDEWKRIRKTIPSSALVPLRVQGGAAPGDGLQKGDAVGRVLELSDGTRSIREMIETLRLSEFDVFEAVFTLVGAGVVRLAGARDLADAAAAAIESSDHERARRFLLHASDLCGDDLELHYDIGTLLLWAGQEEPAANHLDLVLGKLLDEGLSGQVEQMLDHLRAEFPDVPYSYERRLRLLDPDKDVREALPLTRRLLELYDFRGDMRTANRMLNFIGRFRNIGFEDLLSLGELLEAHGEFTAAARQYYLAAKQLRRSVGGQEALRIYRKAISLDSRLTAARREIQYLLGAPGRRRRRLLKAAVWVVLAFAVSGGVTFVAQREEAAKKALEPVSVRAEELLARSAFDEAASLYRSYTAEHPNTVAGLRVRQKIEDIEADRRAFLASRSYTVDLLLRAAERAESRLDFDEALAQYRTARIVALDEDAVEKAQANIQRLLTEKRDYTRHLTEARAHEATGRYQQALDSLLSAHRCSPRLFEKDGLRLPLVIESRPSGAQVTRDGKVLGRTPLVLRRAIDEAVSVTISREGSYGMDLHVPPDGTRAVVRADLVDSRSPLWTFRSTGLIRPTLLPDGTTLYFTSSAGSLHAVDVRTGTELWERPLGTVPGAYVSEPVIVGSRVFVAAMDGSLRAFARDSGQELWRRPGQGFVSGPPVHLMSEDLLLLVHVQGQLHWVHPTDGQTVRTGTLPRPVVGPRLVVGDVLLYGTAEQAIEAFDTNTGRLRWKWRPGYAPNHDLLVSGGRLYAAFEEGKVLSALLEDGKTLWSFDASGKCLLSPATDGERLFVASRDGSLIALDARTGRTLWVTLVGSPVDVGVAEDGGRVYVAGAEKTLSAFNAADGRLLWKTALPGSAPAPPMAAFGRVFVTTTDGLVQVFER